MSDKRDYELCDVCGGDLVICADCLERESRDNNRERTVADAVYVLRWILQRHEAGASKLPENIEAIARRAMNGYRAQVYETIR